MSDGLVVKIDLNSPEGYTEIHDVVDTAYKNEMFSFRTSSNAVHTIPARRIDYIFTELE